MSQYTEPSLDSLNLTLFLALPSPSHPFTLATGGTPLASPVAIHMVHSSLSLQRISSVRLAPFSVPTSSFFFYLLLRLRSAQIRPFLAAVRRIWGRFPSALRQICLVGPSARPDSSDRLRSAPFFFCCCSPDLGAPPFCFSFAAPLCTIQQIHLPILHLP